MAKKLFLYMAKRDKKGVKVLTVFECENYIKVPATRIQDISILNMPKQLESTIQKTLYQNRFLWESWTETAEDYTTLKASLKSRGYKNLAIYANILHPIKCDVLVGQQESQHNINMNRLSDSAQQTMVRKQT